MDNISFKERVKNVSIENVEKYKEVFIDNEYLIFSREFKYQDYYIIKADLNNYLHLIGIHTNLSPKEFYNKLDLILRRKRGQKKFDEVVYGDISVVKVNREIKMLIQK